METIKNICQQALAATPVPFTGNQDVLKSCKEILKNYNLESTAPNLRSLPSSRMYFLAMWSTEFRTLIGPELSNEANALAGRIRDKVLQFDPEVPVPDLKKICVKLSIKARDQSPF